MHEPGEGWQWSLPIPAIRLIGSLASVPTPARLRRPPSVGTVTAASLLDHAPNYRSWIVDLCSPHLAGPMLEASQGTSGGTFTLNGDAVDANGLFGSAVMIDVLECVEDDHALLQQVFERLEPGGRLCIWAPTYEFLSSPFDAKLGRRRRYRKRQLEGAVRLAGYEVVEGRHVNLPGWLGWLILCRLLRREPTARMVAVLDTSIVPAVRWIETRVRVPIALSVFLVARKPQRSAVTN